MKAQSSKAGKGGSQRRITEKGNAAVSKAKAAKAVKKLRPEGPGKVPGFRKVSKAVAKRLSDGRKMGR